MTSAVLDAEDRCPTLAYIANTVAKNRTIREIYEREADDKGCSPAANARSVQRTAAAGLVQAQLANATGKSFVVSDYSTKSLGRPGFLEIYLAE